MDIINASTDVIYQALPPIIQGHLTKEEVAVIAKYHDDNGNTEFSQELFDNWCGKCKTIDIITDLWDEQKVRTLAASYINGKRLYTGEMALYPEEVDIENLASEVSIFLEVFVIKNCVCLFCFDTGRYLYHKNFGDY